MPAIDYRPVSAVDFRAFTAAFNQAYSDYYTPIMMTPNAFQALITRDDLDLDASVVAVNGDEIVGTGLLGIRNEQGWIGGMGVIPEWRRQGIGQQMMHYLLARAREHRLSVIRLEVIEANVGAHRLYQKLGFSDLRMLHILERAPQSSPPNHIAYNVVREDATTVLAHYKSFHKDVRNCWQRGQPSLFGLSRHAQGLLALGPQGATGYMLGWYTPHEIRVADLATSPALRDARSDVATALLAHAHRQYPRAIGNAYNVAEDDPILSAYHRTGYITDYCQIEMELSLTD